MDEINSPSSDAARRFLARKTFGHVIDGRLVPSASGQMLDTIDPSFGKVLARLAAGDREDVDRAVKAARAAFEGPWSRWTPYERQTLLYRIHDVIDRHYDELAEIEAMDMGAPIARLRAGKPAILKMILFFAAQSANISGETLQNGLPGTVTTMTLTAPVGVVGGIIPWNGPLGAQWWVIGPALASGCTTVLKPAEDASLSILRTAELLLEAGVPPGVVNVVTGTGTAAGAALAAHSGVDRIAFTGSTATGRKIIEASASNMKKLQLELGGKSPDIIFADADLDAAVPGATIGVFANSGQICFAGTRVLVQRSIADEFCTRAAAFSRQIRVGRSLDEAAQLGPLISAQQRDRVASYLDSGVADGARLICGGERLGGSLADGYFISPTIFADVDNSMRIAREEIFGPVMSVIPFDTVDEAIKLGNQTEYGLGGAVWTKDVSTAMQVVRGITAGVMWVNCYGLIDPMVGFGGTKHSGYGVKGGRGHLDLYTYRKTVYINA